MVGIIIILFLVPDVHGNRVRPSHQRYISSFALSAGTHASVSAITTKFSSNELPAKSSYALIIIPNKVLGHGVHILHALGMMGAGDPFEVRPFGLRRPRFVATHKHPHRFQTVALLQCLQLVERLSVQAAGEVSEKRDGELLNDIGVLAEFQLDRVLVDVLCLHLRPTDPSIHSDSPELR